jgi:diguanylate cyclase (GGDEF)-like protein/PAS domain S-box-containing protein
LISEARKLLEQRLAWLKPILLPATIGLMVLVTGGIFVDRQNTYLAEEQMRAEVLAQASLIRAKLEGNINGNIQLVRGLVSTMSTEPDMNQTRFSALVTNLFAEHSQLRSVAAAPDLVVSLVYPLAGNEKAIGLDYRQNEAQRDSVLRARDTGTLVLAGPVDLVQGGRGFIGRFPVFVDGPAGKTFWGVVSAVVDVGRLYADSGLLDPTLGIEISIRGRDASGELGARFFGPDLSAQDPVTAGVVLPSGSWEISAIPKGGWFAAHKDAWKLRLALLAAGALILLPIIITGRLVGERQLHFRELKAREAALQRLSRRLGLALETSRVGVWEMDLVTEELIWDDRMNELNGYPADGGKRTYEHWRKGLHPDDLARAESDFRKGIRSGSYRSEFRTVGPDGKVRHIRSLGGVYNDEDSHTKILGVNWDVSADVTLTAELKAREADLAQVTRRLGLALEASKIGVWELDLATGDETWDDRMNELYGMPADGQLRNNAHWRATVHPDDLQRAQEEFQCMMQPNGRYECTFRVVHPDGSIRHIKSVGVRFTEGNDHQRVIGVNWDVTKDVELNEDLRLAKQATEAHNRELDAARVRIEYNSLHDSLTGLPNRRYLDEKLRAMEAEGFGGSGSIALLHIDLDRFKQINDTLGHAAGDAMLIHASSVLLSNCGWSDFVARIGGDEFVVLTSAKEGNIYLSTLAEQIVSEMRRPVVYEGHECRFGVSIGIAAERGTPIDCKRLLINADIALYRAKGRGRNRFEFFSEALQAEVVNSKRVADEILAGLERTEFIAFYQPQFDAHSLDLVGVEALARWNHPVQGIRAPDAFLPMAEELNVVATIDRLILEQALADLNRWQAQGLEVPRASVNVSLRRLHDENLIKGLRELQIEPGRISFELVESIYLDESDAIVGWNIDQIKDLGIDVEIDDFGTGYASILSLQKLRPKRLKIDRQLVHPILEDEAQRRLLLSIIDIGKSMGIEIVAEGVETMEHARILRDLGCDILQGYAFAKPMSARELEQLLRSQAWRKAS